MRLKIQLYVLHAIVCVCARACMCVCVCACMRVCVCVCVHIIHDFSDFTPHAYTSCVLHLYTIWSNCRIPYPSSRTAIALPTYLLAGYPPQPPTLAPYSSLHLPHKQHRPAVRLLHHHRRNIVL
jgi:hypothetical protein